jgi:hypothetical protein
MFSSCDLHCHIKQSQQSGLSRNEWNCLFGAPEHSVSFSFLAKPCHVVPARIEGARGARRHRNPPSVSLVAIARAISANASQSWFESIDWFPELSLLCVKKAARHCTRGGLDFIIESAGIFPPSDMI